MAKSWLPREHAASPAPELAAVSQPNLGSNADRQFSLGLGDGATQGLPSREAVSADPAAYGVPEGCPPEDYFLEYVARLSQQDPDFLDASQAESPEEAEAIARHQALIRSWGYDPEAVSWLEDKNTGLAAMRLDPLDPDSELGSIVSFRGTEFGWQGDEASFDNPLGGLNDVFTDIGNEIGGNQYAPNKEAIRAFLEAGQGGLTLTGQSLGGTLAGLAAADNADLIDTMVGFQSPGVSRETADRFDKANADDHVDVRYHSSTDDIVHRSGEARLDGTFYDYQSARDLSIPEAHGAYFLYDDIGFGGTGDVGDSGPRTVSAHREDPVGERELIEGGRQVGGGLLNTLGAPLQGLWHGVTGLTDAGANAWENLSDTGSAVWDNWSGGDLLGGLWEGALGLGETGMDLVGDTGGALWDMASTTVGQAWDGLGTMGSGVENLGRAGVEGLGWLADKGGDLVDFATSW